MNPNAAFSASLVVSLVLWYPSMQACLRGDLDLTPAALRYLLALTISRLAMGLLARLITAYRAAQLPAAPLDGAPAAGPSPSAPAAPTPESDAGTPHRRRSDRTAGSEGATAAEGGIDPASLAA